MHLRPSFLALAGFVVVACGGGTPALRSDPLPGAPPFDAELVDRLHAAWADRSEAYAPRTRHLLPDGAPRYTNRLFLESSPYLRQHAHNPVNWYPWGDEAFETARRLGRPVLLSVGYSTCHWCHVMEEESFEDEEIARYLNEHYVAVKVDREERPDVDAVYMNAVQTLTRGGGWPMTVWLTPAREPFYGGTYFPARDGDRGSRAGFLTVLRTVAAAYHEQPARVAEAAASLAEQVRANLEPDPTTARPPDAAVLHDAMTSCRRLYDESEGGTRGAPKFPGNLPVRFLLRYHRRTGDPDALAMATRTLEKMAAGGIRDQVGGGFHRYATDARWLVPHFEKMLYDNALLALAYLEAYQATGRDDFAAVAREILRDVERTMTAPEGGFYSATDADSPTPDGRREEGWFFTWTPAELAAVLDAEQTRLVEAHYGVTADGDFEGRSILHVATPLDAAAATAGVPPARAAEVIAAARERLYAARARRPPPLRDEKVLAAWNGLMIAAHARAAFVLGDDAHARAAARAATFVLGSMRRDGRLLRTWTHGTARHPAYLEDYAFMIAGLLDLFEATGDPRWLGAAVDLDRVLAAHYEDAAAGGFFMTSNDHEALLARQKPDHDGAEPSGNSVQALNLLRLHDLTTDDAYRRRADRTLDVLGGAAARAPLALSELLLALDYRLDTPKEIVVVAPRSRADAAPFLAALRTRFVPNRIIAVTARTAELAAMVPLVEGKAALGGAPTGYVCENRVCDLPTTDPAVFARQVARVRPLPAAQTPGG